MTKQTIQGLCILEKLKTKPQCLCKLFSSIYRLQWTIHSSKQLFWNNVCANQSNKPLKRYFLMLSVRLWIFAFSASLGFLTLYVEGIIQPLYWGLFCRLLIRKYYLLYKLTFLLWCFIWIKFCIYELTIAYIINYLILICIYCFISILWLVITLRQDGHPALFMMGCLTVSVKVNTTSIGYI